MDKLMVAIYAILESGRITMGASLAGMEEGKGWALQGSARALLPQLKAVIESCKKGDQMNLNDALYLMLELNRISMGAALGGMRPGKGWALQGNANEVLPRLKTVRDFFSLG